MKKNEDTFGFELLVSELEDSYLNKEIWFSFDREGKKIVSQSDTIIIKSITKSSKKDFSLDEIDSNSLSLSFYRDLDHLISTSTGIPVIVAEDPLTCVARGGGQALEIMDKYNIDLLSSE